MRVDINFGKGRYPVELSDDWQVTIIRKPPMPIEADEAFAVARALESPVNCAPLREQQGMYLDVRYHAAGAQRGNTTGPD